MRGGWCSARVPLLAFVLMVPAVSTSAGQSSQQATPDQLDRLRIPRTVYLRGRVTLEDGSPPPDIVIVELGQGGEFVPAVHTDAKGRFAFAPGQREYGLADASFSPLGGLISTGPIPGTSLSGFGAQTLLEGEVRASLPGYRSSLIRLGNQSAFDNPEIGVLVLHRIGSSQGAALAQTPKDARAAFEKGLDAFGRRDSDAARKHFEKAVEIYPAYAAAWFRLGAVYQQQKRSGDAKNAYRRAAAASDSYPEPLRQLAGLAIEEKDWETVAGMTGRLIGLDPAEGPSVYYYNAVANFYLNKLDMAETRMRESLRLDVRRRNPRAELILGVILERKGDYRGAAEHLRSYLSFAPGASDVDAARTRLAEMEGLSATGTAAEAQPR